MRKILFMTLILAALLLAAEVGVTLLSQHGMERALRSQYELPSSLVVSINSFPYLVSLARNHIGELQMTWEGEVQYHAGEGSLETMPYRGSVNLYDVELSMPSLLSGRLEVRDISRQKARISLGIEDLASALGMKKSSLTAEDGRLFMQIEGEKTQYKVKVAEETTLSFEPLDGSIEGTGSSPNPDEGIKAIDFYYMPLDAKLSTACVKGEGIEIEISIPMWEGYLDSLKYDLKKKPLS